MRFLTQIKTQRLAKVEPPPLRGPLPRLFYSVGIAVMAGLGGCDFYIVPNQNQVQPVVSAAVVPPAAPTPLPNSEHIVFMDSTTAQLDGCRSLSSLKFTHNGNFADGMIIMRNAAIQMNANRMVPLRIIENINNTDGPHLYHVKLLRCPNPEKMSGQDNG